MSPDDPRHGTTAGFSAGCRLRCCREARNADERTRRKRREVLGIVRRIDNLPTRRRIEALWAMGWTSKHIADECGWGTPQAVTEVVANRGHCYVSTAATIAAAYERMSTTEGPSVKNRREAQRKGWALPGAWLNIDDPAEQPDPGWRPVRNRPGHELLSEWEHLRSFGVSIHQAARQLGVTVEAIEVAARRADKGAA